MSMLKHAQGQALLEYIFVFAIFSLIAISAAKGIAIFSEGFFKNFTYHLTQELTTGACAQGCWHNGYENLE
ncbi:hypothetical protein [Bacteriovorax sp. Seq25_V]|uniref:hypothetical protein n=1 Tax=Bacteriovorax sp. Seq25_V TaxID=1201288 RepID=UPI0012FA911F|nr:hypothetical protein [Bacteriovorax sp. Seq25_V]